ncbi:uncharacterized protein PITG_17927 [Phytophthora infestans T30-4]|uniref:Uncharacterized protein n=1 Tax=Phytophthora infestans (strain T30-4) TaxID=403677 RepID=D0NXA4_PHYIT|nr:uncharacterized protein PITG_17927 [Phytophthora infestans T30-4]EEY67701.1 hypothetical protein PITG_17927 [Phytophthora infestans T30-4]|eukprot:XP_002896254.1 hypothetical protein PITG_17927 [Phytophthora infestans T30-4]
MKDMRRLEQGPMREKPLIIEDKDTGVGIRSSDNKLAQALDASKAVTYCDTGEFGDATEYDGSFTASDDADVNDVADVYDGVDVYDGADVTSTVTRLTKLFIVGHPDLVRHQHWATNPGVQGSKDTLHGGQYRDVVLNEDWEYGYDPTYGKDENDHGADNNYGSGDSLDAAIGTGTAGHDDANEETSARQPAQQTTAATAQQPVVPDRQPAPDPATGVSTGSGGGTA